MRAAARHMKSATNRARRRKSGTTKGRRYGGRATAAGVAYESRIAASIAVTMLCGAKSALWDAISGNDIAAVTLQAPEAVDDVVVTFRSVNDAKAFVSAKHRSQAIPITKASPAFTEPLEAFVAQFLQLPQHARQASRFVWAIPTSGGTAATKHLPTVLDAHRAQAFDAPLAEFINSRSLDEKRVFRTVCDLSSRALAKHTGKMPTEQELREFLRLVYVEVYDFGMGSRYERTACQDLRTHVVSKPSEARKAWRTLEQIFERNLFERYRAASS